MRPGAWSDQQWGFFSYLFLAARLEGVTGVDYHAAETAILRTMGTDATSMYLVKAGYYRYGYVPADHGTVNYLSRGLEFATQLAGLAHLGYVLGDGATYRDLLPVGQGVPQDLEPRPQDLPGQERRRQLGTGRCRAVRGHDRPTTPSTSRRTRWAWLTSTAQRHEHEDRPALRRARHLVQRLSARRSRTWPSSANSPSVSQDVIRNYFLPEFSSLSMWEDLPGSGSLYYTDNASAAVLANLGIYPIQSPGVQWILNSPAVAAAVIHGRQTRPSWPLGTRRHPVCLVPAGRRLGLSQLLHLGPDARQRGAHTLTFGMTSTPSRIGRLDLAGTDGEVLSASTDNRTYLRFSHRPARRHLAGGHTRGRAACHSLGERPAAAGRPTGRTIRASIFSRCVAFRPERYCCASEPPSTSRVLPSSGLPMATVFLARSQGPAAPRKLLYRVSKLPIFNPIAHIYLHVLVCLDA